MKKILVVTAKELKSYFISPSAYGILLVFSLISGFFFFSNLSVFYLAKMQPLPWAELEAEQSLNRMVIQPFIHNLSLLYLLLPVLTMKLLAEEKKMKTTELIFTCPISLSQIIIGKFLACLLLLSLMLILTLPHPIFLILYGNPDIGPIISGYLGLFLAGAAFISLGIFASSLTENQIIAAILGFFLVLFFWMIGGVSYMVGYQLSQIVAYLSLQEHFHIFTKGLIELKSIVYFLSFSFFWLFLSHQTLNSYRWR